MGTSYAGAADPFIKQGIRVLAERLLHADPEWRRQQAAAIFTSLRSTGRLLLVERLMHQLKSKCDATRKEALASLADLGPAVARILLSKLYGARTEASRIRLVELLGEIGPRLPPSAHGGIQHDLLIALSRARSERVAAAIVAADQRLRGANAGV
jgi:hypothetical protein